MNLDRIRQVLWAMSFVAVSFGAATPASAGWYYMNGAPAANVPADVNDVNGLNAQSDNENEGGDEEDLGIDDVLNANADGPNLEPESLSFAPLVFAPSNEEDGLQIAQIAQIPEPLTLALLGIALAGLGLSRRKRNV